jgi:hypothetical protein
MMTPQWLKPGLGGVVLGAGALAIVGFASGAFVTDGTAQQMAANHAKFEVLAALVPICVEQSVQDPQLAEKLNGLKVAKSFERSDLVVKTGWATMPGSAESNQEVAAACAKKLFPAS